MRGSALNVLLAVCTTAGVLALAGPGSAGPGDGFAGALSRGKARLIRCAVGPQETATHILKVKNPATLARFDVETSKTLAPTQGADVARALADSLGPMGLNNATTIEVDFYAKGRCTEIGPSRLSSVGWRTLSDNPSGALWGLEPSLVDVTKPVAWYLRVVWWRPFTIRAGEIVDTGKWEPTYWRADGNAIAAGEDGSSAVHTPELVK